MRNLSVFIEWDGKQIYVGNIRGKQSNDAVFSYAPEYINNLDNRPISINLPLEEQSFAPDRTRIFLKVFCRKALREGVWQTGCMWMKATIYRFCRGLGVSVWEL